jgi:NUC153 domain
MDEKRREHGADMEISFTPGLSMTKDDTEETTLEKYQRKMKEKRKKRKEVMKENSKGQNTDGRKRLEDEFLDDGSGESSDDVSQDLRSKKHGSNRNPNKVTDSGSHPNATPEELALLLASDNPTGAIKHFDMSAVLKSEKKGRRKVKGKKTERKGDDELQEDFVIDVNDDRFKPLHEDHTFAIDPSNP